MSDLYNGDMDLVVDTSAIIAVIADEPEKPAILAYTTDSNLVVPASVRWEIGNALSSMFKRGRITLARARLAIRSYQRMRLQFVDVDLEQALELSEQMDIYAYDAYVLVTALNLQLPLLTLDSRMATIAPQIGARTLEVNR